MLQFLTDIENYPSDTITDILFNLHTVIEKVKEEEANYLKHRILVKNYVRTSDLKQILNDYISKDEGANVINSEYLYYKTNLYKPFKNDYLKVSKTETEDGIIKFDLKVLDMDNHVSFTHTDIFRAKNRMSESKKFLNLDDVDTVIFIKH